MNQLKSMAQNILKKLKSMFLANQLTVNLVKTNFSVYSNKTTRFLKELFVDGCTIKRTTVVKYLRMCVDKKLK